VSLKYILFITKRISLCVLPQTYRLEITGNYYFTLLFNIKFSPRERIKYRLYRPWLSIKRSLRILNSKCLHKCLLNIKGTIVTQSFELKHFLIFRFYQNVNQSIFMINFKVNRVRMNVCSQWIINYQKNILNLIQI